MLQLPPELTAAAGTLFPWAATAEFITEVRAGGSAWEQTAARLPDASSGRAYATPAAALTAGAAWTKTSAGAATHPGALQTQPIISGHAQAETEGATRRALLQSPLKAYAGRKRTSASRAILPSFPTLQLRSGGNAAAFTEGWTLLPAVLQGPLTENATQPWIPAEPAGSGTGLTRVPAPDGIATALAAAGALSVLLPFPSLPLTEAAVLLLSAGAFPALSVKGLTVPLITDGSATA